MSHHAVHVFHFGWSDWKTILQRTKEELSDDHVPILAAGVAFYFMLAVFPLLLGLVTLYGLVADPATVERQLESMMGMMPPAATELMRERLHNIVETAPSTLGIGLVLSLVGALWSGSSGINALIKAVNTAYDEEETRGFFKVRGMAVLGTLALLVGGAVAILTITALPALLASVGVPAGVIGIISWLRWPLLFVAVVFALMYVYRWSPDRRSPKLRWVSPGATVAAALWVGASMLLSVYTSRFGSYEATYGALAGVVVLLIWLYVSSFAFLLGAELNSEMEAHARRDTTVDDRAGPTRSREAESASRAHPRGPRRAGPHPERAGLNAP